MGIATQKLNVAFMAKFLLLLSVIQINIYYFSKSATMCPILKICHHFSQHRIDLINSVKYIFEGLDSLSDNAEKDLLSYGDPHFDINKNKFMLETTLFYIKSTERFSGSLFD